MRAGGSVSFRVNAKRARRVNFCVRRSHTCVMKCGLHIISLVAAAGWADAAAQANAEGPSILSLLGLVFLFVAVGVLASLLLQRFAEWLSGRWQTTIRELMLYTFLAALLCTLLLLVERMHGR
jgi:hypothetical protein